MRKAATPMTRMQAQTRTPCRPPQGPVPAHSPPGPRRAALVRAAAIGWFLAASQVLAQLAADPASDAPEGEGHFAGVAPGSSIDASSHAQALQRWRNASDIHAWIAAHFRYDAARALQLSETQRQKNGRMPITEPGAFFARPSGVCVDLARFAFETLRHIDPDARAAYLMIEFDPVTLAGNVLRRHWLVTFEAAGQRYFFADSKRPGVMAGPYASTRDFVDEYARYRGRRIVAFAERDSFERQLRATARQPARPLP